METTAIKKRKADPKIGTEFLVSPIVACDGYESVAFDPDEPRAIPLPDGPFGDNPYVVVQNRGKRVTFDLQEGPTEEGVNGTFPDALIQVAKVMLELKNVGDLTNRHTSMAISKLEEALLILHARRADRHARGVLGTYKR